MFHDSKEKFFLLNHKSVVQSGNHSPGTMDKGPDTIEQDSTKIYRYCVKSTI